MKEPYKFSIGEIRVGSQLYIQDSPKANSIVTVTPTMIKLLQDTPNIFNYGYEPIVLTDELLPKIWRMLPDGPSREFWKQKMMHRTIETNHWWSRDLNEYSKLELCHAFDGEDGYHCWLNNTLLANNFVPIIDHNKFKYFHQLQNLFTALTGSEITIKL